MVKATALEVLKGSDGRVVGYKLKDEMDKIMDVNTESIKKAMSNNLISINNLYIDKENKLLFGMSQEEYNSKIKDSQGSGVVSKVSTGQVQQNNANVTPMNNETYHINNNGNSTVDKNSDKAERIKNLVKKLNQARMVYEQGDDEIMSNFEYDKLYDELKQLEEETGIILNNSPTINVGYQVVSKLQKKQHTTPMLSLEKTKDVSDLKAFLGTHEGVLSWKLDGLTVVLEYNLGELVEAVTRGNGEVGEIVTANALTFTNLPRKIPFMGHIKMRGEATISYSDFEKINSSLSAGEEPYKNPRNLCSGSVRQLDSSITSTRNVKWTCFNIEETDGALPNEYDKQMDWAKLMGFDAVEYSIVNASNIDAAISKFESKIKNGSMNIPSDGLVLTYRDRAYGKSLGATAKAPRHSKAFKWQDEEAVTTITGVDWSVGKSGVITPVIEFEPVDIEGSTIARASSHNVSIFLDMEFGYGDKINVFKANMIIPQISENLTRSKTCEIPGKCPCCGYDTEIHEDPKSGIYTLWCMNPDCEAKGNRLFKHFVSRDAMNIEGISGATLETLSEIGVVTDLESIFRISEHRNEIITLEGFGEKSYTNMINAIDKARNVKVANLIYALAIPNIGLATAKLICKNFGNDLGNIVSATYGQLIDIDGIGDSIASSFTDYFNDENNLEAFIRLVKQLHIIKEEVSTNTEMAGVTICVTGDVYVFKNRRQVKDIVEELGGKLTGSVSRSTSYLVTNDTTSGSNKNKAAAQYGIPILSEQEFIDKFNLQQYI